jgi:hypothetical protein
MPATRNHHTVGIESGGRQDPAHRTPSTATEDRDDRGGASALGWRPLTAAANAAMTHAIDPQRRSREDDAAPPVGIDQRLGAGAACPRPSRSLPDEDSGPDCEARPERGVDGDIDDRGGARDRRRASVAPLDEEKGREAEQGKDREVREMEIQPPGEVVGHGRIHRRMKDGMRQLERDDEKRRDEESGPADHYRSPSATESSESTRLNR